MKLYHQHNVREMYTLNMKNVGTTNSSVRWKWNNSW